MFKYVNISLCNFLGRTWKISSINIVYTISIILLYIFSVYVKRSAFFFTDYIIFSITIFITFWSFTIMVSEILSVSLISSVLWFIIYLETCSDLPSNLAWTSSHRCCHMISYCHKTTKTMYHPWIRCKTISLLAYHQCCDWMVIYLETWFSDLRSDLLFSLSLSLIGVVIQLLFIWKHEFHSCHQTLHGLLVDAVIVFLQ